MNQLHQAARVRGVFPSESDCLPILTSLRTKWSGRTAKMLTSGSQSMIKRLEFRVWILVYGLGFRVYGLRNMVWGAEI